MDALTLISAAGLYYIARSQRVRSSYYEGPQYIPPEGGDCPIPEFAGMVNPDPDYWEEIGKTPAKIEATQIINTLEGCMAPPNYGEFKAEYEKWSKAWGVPVDIIRATHKWESGYYPKPLSMNSKTSALGLAQFVKATAAEQGVPWPYCLDWRVSVYLTAKYIHARGWYLGTQMPPAEWWAEQYELAGTDAEDDSYYAFRGYWGAYPIDHESFGASQVHVRNRSGLAYALGETTKTGALQGFSAVTADVGQLGKNWNKATYKETGYA